MLSRYEYQISTGAGAGTSARPGSLAGPPSRTQWDVFGSGLEQSYGSGLTPMKPAVVVPGANSWKSHFQ